MVFIESSAFTRAIDDYLSDTEYLRRQMELMANPETGTVMPGTGGFRKLRWKDERRKKGQRGGLRIIYAHFPEEHQVWFLTLFDKDEAGDLSPEAKRALKEAMEDELRYRAAARLKRRKRRPTA